MTKIKASSYVVISMRIVKREKNGIVIPGPGFVGDFAEVCELSGTIGVECIPGNTITYAGKEGDLKIEAVEVHMRTGEVPVCPQTIHVDDLVDDVS